MISRIRKRLIDLAYPEFKCEDCTGITNECGVCYCYQMNAVGPCTPPGFWIKLLRWMLSP